MKRKVFSSFLFAALLGMGTVGVVSCADYDSDINYLQVQVTENTKLTEALENRVNNMENQIKVLQDALNGIKSCQCGDVDAKIKSEIEKALAGLNYASPEDVAKAITEALAGIKTGLTNEEVQALIEAYHNSHPDCECGDIKVLIENYLKENPGLSESDVEAIVKAYHDAHPQSTLDENDVKSIVETYINQLQHFTKEQIEAMINTAIAQALANYTSCTCNSYTKSEVDALIKAAIEAYAATDGHGLTAAEVQALIDAAIAKIKHPESGLNEAQVNAIVSKAIAEALKDINKGLATEEYVKKLVEEAKCNCPALTEQQVASIAATVIEQYMKDHPYTLDTEAVKNIANTAIENSTIINNIRQSITTLEQSVNEVKAALQNVYTKDQVYTKAEVEALIRSLIQESVKNCNCDNTALSPEQKATIEQLISAAIQAYNAAHPDCNCEYDAAAFADLVQKVADNADAIKGIVIPDVSNFITNTQLEQAINEVKALIPAAPDLSGYVTIAYLTEQLTTVNLAIASAEAKAQTALEKANSAFSKAEANEQAITNLQNAVKDLNDLYINISNQLTETTRKAEIAFNRSLSNYFEIESLKSLYEQLLSKVENLEEKGYDDSELRGRIEKLEALKTDLETLQNQIKDFVTKDELGNYVTRDELGNYVTTDQLGNYVTLDALSNYVTAEQLTQAVGKALEDAKTYAKDEAEKAAADALTKAKEYAKNYTDTEIGKIKGLYEEADKLLQGQINKINDAITGINKRLDDLENDVDALKTKVDNMANNMAKLITNIELQGTKNPAFGYYSLPVGVTSNVLMAYYGEALKKVQFPAVGDWGLVYGEEENQITPEDWARITPAQFKRSGNVTLIGDTGNAGKLLLTVNPSSVDFTGTEFKLVNSIGEESPVTLGNLKPCTEKLTFGQTRATVEGEKSANGFYEATATVTKDNLDALKFTVNKQVENALEEIARDKLGANLTNLVQALYNQFNGVLDAYAVQATWKDADNKEHTVTSKYGIAATAVKPLGYEFMKGQSFKFPVITPLSELNINLRDYIDLSMFNKEFKEEDLGLNIKFDFADIWYDEADGCIKADIEVTEKNKHYVEKAFVLVSADGVYTDPHTGVTKTFTGYKDNKELAAFLAAMITNGADAYSAQLAQEFEDNIKKLLDKINDITAPGGLLESTANNLLDKVQDKLNSLLGTADKLIGQVNDITDRLRRLLNNPNYYLQAVVAYPATDGFYHPISTSKGMPTIVKSGSGEGIELWVTSLNAEIFVPAFKKYIAVTNVFKGDKDADSDASLMAALQKANSTEYFNEYFDGDRYGVVFTPDTSLKGATYEIVYSALDYFGGVSQQKYYVTVE